jgi:hypothetical protein
LALPARDPTYDGVVGRVFQRAGRGAEGTEYLRRAAASCLGYAAPFLDAQARLAYADVLAAANDIRGACAQLERVVSSWAGARPPSTSALRAAARKSALRCP